jgi:hypothetical protein
VANETGDIDIQIYRTPSNSVGKLLTVEDDESVGERRVKNVPNVD